MRASIVILGALLLGGCVGPFEDWSFGPWGGGSEAPENAWKVRDEVAVTGVGTRVASHGRWERSRGKCRPKSAPSIELTMAPSHGAVRFDEEERRPDKCKKSFQHATVHYTSRTGYVGEDRFSYQRIDPEDGSRKLVIVNVLVQKQRVSRAVEQPQAPATDLTLDVRWLQRQLNARGYDPGPIDGRVGPRTRAAIARYQAAQGLPVTGSPGRDVAASLAQPPAARGR